MVVVVFIDLFYIKTQSRKFIIPSCLPILMHICRTPKKDNQIYRTKNTQTSPVPYQQIHFYLFHFFQIFFFGQILGVRWRKVHFSVGEVTVHRAAGRGQQRSEGTGGMWWGEEGNEQWDDLQSKNWSLLYTKFLQETFNILQQIITRWFSKIKGFPFRFWSKITLDLFLF